MPAQPSLDVDVRLVNSLKPSRQKMVMQLVLESQRYQKGELDKDDIKSSDFESDWREFFARALKDSKQAIFVAMKKDKPIGYIRIRLNAKPKKNGAEIDDVYVSASHRRRGVANKLLDQAKTWAKEHKASSLNALVARANSTAVDMYAELGFELKPSSYLDYQIGL